MTDHQECLICDKPISYGPDISARLTGSLRVFSDSLVNAILDQDDSECPFDRLRDVMQFFEKEFWQTAAFYLHSRTEKGAKKRQARP